jgi:predicted  nucleic acid-binding Zn-ribbon protein
VNFTKRSILETLLTRSSIIMATVQEIQAELAQMKTDIATEREQAQAQKAKLSAANDKIGALEAEVTLLKNKGSASEAEINALAAGVSEARAMIKDIVEDVPQVPPVE